jgi:hypothetical protein
VRAGVGPELLDERVSRLGVGEHDLNLPDKTGPRNKAVTPSVGHPMGARPQPTTGRR